MNPLTVGVQAPDFELKTAGGQPSRLSEALRDGPVLLAFYKASCPTCGLTFPFIQRIYSEIGNTPGFAIWGISQDEPEETHKFREENRLEFPILIDEHPYAVSSSYGLVAVPTLFVVNTDRTIRLGDYGFSKATLNQVAEIAAHRTNRPPVRLFQNDDRLPETRPG